MTEFAQLSWRDEVCDAMQIGFTYKQRQLIAKRDELLRKNRAARAHLVSFGDVRNAKYRWAQRGVQLLNQQLRQARDDCNELLDEAQLVDNWQEQAICAVEWYMAGVVVRGWTTVGFLIQSDLNDDCLHILFGGVDRVNGIGHGHIVLLPGGQISYRRDPGGSRGIHNRRHIQLVSSTPTYVLS